LLADVKRPAGLAGFTAGRKLEDVMLENHRKGYSARE
jgi:hypothetical protein